MDVLWASAVGPACIGSAAGAPCAWERGRAVLGGWVTGWGECGGVDAALCPRRTPPAPAPHPASQRDKCPCAIRGAGCRQPPTPRPWAPRPASHCVHRVASGVQPHEADGAGALRPQPRAVGRGPRKQGVGLREARGGRRRGLKLRRGGPRQRARQQGRDLGVARTRGSGRERLCRCRARPCSSPLRRRRLYRRRAAVRCCCLCRRSARRRACSCFRTWHVAGAWGQVRRRRQRRRQRRRRLLQECAKQGRRLRRRWRGGSHACARRRQQWGRGGV